MLFSCLLMKPTLDASASVSLERPLVQWFNNIDLYYSLWMSVYPPKNQRVYYSGREEQLSQPTALFAIIAKKVKEKKIEQRNLD